MASTDFISLFSGAGGLDLGLEMAGWDCRFASDIDPHAVETLRLNKGLPIGGGVRALSDAHLEQGDVRAQSGAEILAKAGLAKGSVPLLAGGPPCQSWSSAGHQLGWHDPRGQLFEDFVRIANEVDTRWVLFENVRGLLTARGPDGQPGSALELIRQKLLNLGFQTSVTLLNAADFGVAQRRVRLIVVGYRTGDAPLFPEPTHDKSAALVTNLRPWNTLAEALSALPPPTENEIIRPTGKIAAELVDIPPGSGVKSMGKAERTRPNGHWGYKQGAFVADTSLPARTVTANSQQDWVRDPNLGLRKLSPRECAAIQSFPLNWAWPPMANRATLYRLVGNSVPPLLAKAIGTALRQSSQLVADNHSISHRDLVPLPPRLAAAVEYTAREERSNGPSRLAAPTKRKQKIAVQQASSF